MLQLKYASDASDADETMPFRQPLPRWKQPPTWPLVGASLGLSARAEMVANGEGDWARVWHGPQIVGIL